jgi:hypothetical protein
MKLYQKKVLPALVSCQGPGEGKLYAEDGGGGEGGGQDGPLRDFWLTVMALSCVPHPPPPPLLALPPETLFQSPYF